MTSRPHDSKDQPQSAMATQQAYTDCAQMAAGVIAARHRGDLPAAEALMSAFPSAEARTMGFFLLAELSLTLLARITGEDLGDVARDVSLDVAATFVPR